MNSPVFYRHAVRFVKPNLLARNDLRTFWVAEVRSRGDPRTKLLMSFKDLHVAEVGGRG